MSSVQKISVAITSQQADLLKSVVESGEYASVSEVIRDAMQSWQEKRETHHNEIEHLRALWDEGKASGPAQPVDFATIRKNARDALEAALKHGD